MRVALGLFVKQGIQTTSTASISQAAGMATGTLFLYFPTKQDLIHALIMDIGKRQSEAVQGLLHPEYSARETFLAIWEGSIGWFLEHPEAYRYFRQVRESALVAETVVRESDEKYLSYFHEGLRKARAEGLFDAIPLEMVGAFLYQDMAAVLELVAAVPGPAVRTEYLKLGFEIFWRGVAGEDPETRKS